MRTIRICFKKKAGASGSKCRHTPDIGLVFERLIETLTSLCSRLIKNTESTLTASNGVSSFDDILCTAIAAPVFNASDYLNRVDPGSRLHGSPRSAHFGYCW